MAINAYSPNRLTLLCVLALILLVPEFAGAHCDTMNGPVVTAAKKALETENVNLVLIWVKKGDEQQIRDAFRQALDVRRLGEAAKAMADRYFFETLVRVHRAGEGVPYTGLKPADTGVDPGIMAADHSLETGSVESVVDELTGLLHHGIQENFSRALALKNFAPDDVEAGRRYVEAYVAYIHYVERLHQEALRSSAGHYHEEAEEQHPEENN